MQSNFKTLFFLLLFIMVAGCFQTFQEIRLKSDLSGVIEFKMIYDMDAMAKGMMMQQKMMGMGDPKKKGISEEEKKIFQEQIVEQTESQKEEIQSQLPDGIKLLEFTIDDSKKNKIISKISLEFDHIRNLQKLQDVKISQGNAMGAEGKSNTALLQDFYFEESGNTIIIKQEGQSKSIPQDKVKEKMPPEVESILQMFMKNLSVNFRIRLPYKKYKIIEHNAHKYDKKNYTLYWMYEGEDMMKMIKKGEAPKGIFLKMEKK